MTPLAYGTIALLMVGPDNSDSATVIVFGAGLLGAWSATLFGAGESLYMQRFTGTMGMIAASPAGFFRPVIGFALASATLGVYSIVAVALWSAAVFGIQFSVASIGGVFVAVIVALVSLVAIGVVLAGYYVLSRQAMTVSNLLEFPIWIITGVLIPASVLWPPLQWAGKLLPLGWATDAVRAAIAGGDWLAPSLMAIALSGLYFGVAWILLVRVDRLIRITGELELR